MGKFSEIDIAIKEANEMNYDRNNMTDEEFNENFNIDLGPKQHEYESDFSVYEVSEYKDGKINPLYGMEKYSLTDEDIEALKDGKILYSTINDEYAIVIGLNSTIDNMQGD